jgi:acyl-coenzyme A thioesterase PaaI-like protein
MDYAAIRDGYQQAIPYFNHVGLEVTEVGPGSASVRLPEDDRLHNHVQSQHASALFSAGEAAAGGAFIAAFAERMGEIVPLAESAEIAYRKIARGPITATGRFGEDPPALFEKLDAEGRVRFPVEVELTDGDGDVVADMTVRWYVRRRQS